MCIGEIFYFFFNFQILDNIKLYVYCGVVMGGFDDICIVFGFDVIVMDVLRVWYEVMRIVCYLKQGIEEKMYEEIWVEIVVDEYEKFWLCMEVVGWNFKMQLFEIGVLL